MPGFFLGKVRTGHMWYIGWMDVLVRILFISPKIAVAVGKGKVKTTKQQRTEQQAGCTTTTTERRAHRAAHFIAARNPAACIYFSTFRWMRLAHSTAISEAFVKNVPW